MTGEPRWWELRRAQNLKPATYTCPLCSRRIQSMSPVDPPRIGRGSDRRGGRLRGLLSAPKAPVGLVTALDATIPYSQPMEEYPLANEARVVEAVQKVLGPAPVTAWPAFRTITGSRGAACARALVRSVRIVGRLSR